MKLTRKQEELSYKKNPNVQSVLIVNTITLPNAIKVIKELGFNNFGYDLTENYYRFRQLNPVKHAAYYTHTLNEGVKLVIMRTKLID